MAGGVSELRDRAIAHTLFPPTTLAKAIVRLGFVQADPIRAPARAQDLILRHRVDGYRVGELDRRYPSLPVEEDLPSPRSSSGRSSAVPTTASPARSWTVCSSAANSCDNLSTA
jgi:hypothetical protein